MAIGFGFTSDWLRKWHEISKPISKRINAKPKQMQITFDSHVKIALIGFFFSCDISMSDTRVSKGA